MATSNELPEFERPPVIEVVCGVLFRPIEALLAPHLGLLWNEFLGEYPTCQEVPPLAPVIERFDEPPAVQMEFSDKPPLPRIWFVHGKENGIIQVQRDRFLHNWKKVRPDDEYPRYGSVIKMFRDRITTFEKFLDKTGLGTIQPEQLEMTYVNHIPRGEGIGSLSEVGSVFPDFSWRDNAQRFLPTPETLNWKCVFALPDKVGRLHATIRSAVRRDDNTPILLFELTARGIPKEHTVSEMWSWFDLAHEWIVRGFADLTGDDMHQNIWKRSK